MFSMAHIQTTGALGSCMNCMLIEMQIGSLLQRQVSKFLVGLLVLAAKDKDELAAHSFFYILNDRGEWPEYQYLQYN